MSLAGYPQLTTWVQVLDERLAKVLARSLCKALGNWNYTFRTIEESKDNGEEVEEKLEPQYSIIPVQPISIEILLRNQEISSSVSPSQQRDRYFSIAFMI
jgi:hypothetical protein